MGIWREKRHVNGNVIIVSFNIANINKRISNQFFKTVK